MNTLLKEKANTAAAICASFTLNSRDTILNSREYEVTVSGLRHPTGNHFLISFEDGSGSTSEINDIINQFRKRYMDITRAPYNNLTIVVSTLGVNSGTGTKYFNYMAFMHSKEAE